MFLSRAHRWHSHTDAPTHTHIKFVNTQCAEIEQGALSSYIALSLFVTLVQSATSKRTARMVARSLMLCACVCSVSVFGFGVFSCVFFGAWQMQYKCKCSVTNLHKYIEIQIFITIFETRIFWSKIAMHHACACRSVCVCCIDERLLCLCGWMTFFGPVCSALALN